MVTYQAGAAVNADTTDVLAKRWALGGEEDRGGEPPPGAGAVLQDTHLVGSGRGRTACHRTVDMAPSTGGACSGSIRYGEFQKERSRLHGKRG